MTCVISSCKGERLSAPFIFSHHSQTCLTRSSSSSWSSLMANGRKVKYLTLRMLTLMFGSLKRFQNTDAIPPQWYPNHYFLPFRLLTEKNRGTIVCPFFFFADFPGVICSFSKLFKVWDFTGSCWKWNAALEYSEMQISSSVTATEMQTYTLVFETEFLTCKNWRILKIIIDLFQLILFVFFLSF